GTAPDIALPAADQIIGHRLRLRLRLRVKGVLGDADAHRGVKAQRHRALLQSLQQLVAGDGRELHGQVVEAGAVHADTAADHHDVPALDVGAGGGAGAHPDEGIRPALMELLHADGGGGPPDTGGGNGDPLSIQRALPGGELP
ncbi:Collagen-like protein, partial [Dysosmobacter welbionis]